MGINQSVLKQFDLSENTECRVELHINNRIHVHIGKIQIELSIKEFNKITKSINAGAKQLKEYKDIND